MELVPLVSIQCLVYNHEPYLRQCLDGFVMQKTNFKFEAIVHDDASTDNSAKIIKEYADRYPDIIKPIFEEENQFSKSEGSLGKIMNAACRGKYIAFCEGDDYWSDPYKLQRQIDILEDSDKISIVYTAFKTIDQYGGNIKRPFYEKCLKKSKSGNIFYALMKGNFILTLTVCIRSSVINSQLYTNYCGRKFDYHLFLSAAALGNAFYIPEITGCYRKQNESLMEKDRAFVNRGIHDIYKYFAERFMSGEIKVPIYDRIFVFCQILKRSISLYLKNYDREFLPRILRIFFKPVF